MQAVVVGGRGPRFAQRESRSAKQASEASGRGQGLFTALFHKPLQPGDRICLGGEKPSRIKRFVESDEKVADRS